MKLAMYKPKNIETTKAIDEKFKKAIEEIAGPGHKPAIAQPIRNVSDPIIKDLSIFFLEGKIIFSAKIIDLFFFKR